MKNKKSLNTLKYLLIFTLIFSSFSIASYAEESTKSVKNQEKTMSEFISDSDIVLDVNAELVCDQTVTLDFFSPNSEYYYLDMEYKATDVSFEEISLELLIDDSYPDENAGNLFLPRMWKDSDSRKDMFGNEFAAKQISYDDFFLNHIYKSNAKHTERYKVHIKQGNHTVTLHLIKGEISVSFL
ncbi:MAG: hypothetical protein J5662_08895, partial [Clostridia bacterium]|nr:hypothetical protein [Clostridia bacterium]